MKSLLVLCLLLSSSCETGPPKQQLDAQRAFADLQKIVSFGPRYPSSQASKLTRDFLKQELEASGIKVEEDSFIAQSPKGEVGMTNLLGILPGKKAESILFASHYDTKNIGDPPCPGANDSGSSTALLLELARVISKSPSREFTIRFAFFDGEEAFEEWGPRDSLYGSRHLVEKWRAEKILPQIKAMVLLDMVGDADLEITREAISTNWLTEIVRQSAKELNYEKYFFRTQESLEDDHRPFLRAGVPAIDLIDPNYGPRGSQGLGAYWHSTEDKIERCSPKSLQIVGEVCLLSLEKIEARLR